MEVRTGKLHKNLTDEEFEDLSKRNVELVRITQEQHDLAKAMPAGKRSGWMRNQPCSCGSGRKFKRCCWNKPAVPGLER